MNSGRQRLRGWSRGLGRRRMIRYWDWRAESHADQPSQNRYLDRWRTVFVESFPVEPAAQNLLDVGTGTGFCALPLARMGHRLTAMNLSEGMLSGTRQAALAEELDIPSVQADATAPDLAAESFDGLAARNLLWTLPRPVEVLRRWRELLRLGGSLLISDGMWTPPARSVRRVLSGLLPTSKGHSGLRFEASYLWARPRLPLYRRLDAEHAGRLLRQAGFERIERRYGIFDEDPFGLADSGFFVLHARRPVCEDRPELWEKL